MGRLYAAARAVALPSICFEQFPRGVVEGFSYGPPLVVSAIGELGELVEHDVTGERFRRRMRGPWPRNCGICSPTPAWRIAWEARHGPNTWRSIRRGQFRELAANLRSRAGAPWRKTAARAFRGSTTRTNRDLVLKTKGK
jgi:glycosyltransferase involved in cell wall biosynthesis